ncbi:type IV pilus modification protein PilV [Pseudorhodoferax sp.]|uniref:type IV pilus modification protein PilV n=1 Tax=Pseudorhodoferax sp. TaxID=1993553 RepID=UPI002DD66E84|nr:type IV pilus modification protein PilV [Pseudorhodoferax sp.]
MARRQQGVTLLESMIAIVLVALGVLGILGVQLRTLADTQTAVRRAQAIRLIEDLSERIRANPAALTAGVVANYQIGWNTAIDSVPDCTLDCTPSALASADIAQWKRTVMSTMPLGNASVFAVTDASGVNTRPQLAVMISWRENERQREGDTDAETAAYKTHFALDPVRAGTGDTSLTCPADRICHLQYLQPTLRCLPYTTSAVSNPPVTCP